MDSMVTQRLLVQLRSSKAQLWPPETDGKSCALDERSCTCILASANQYTRQDAVSIIFAIRMRIEEKKIVDSKKQDARKKKGASKNKEESKKN